MPVYNVEKYIIEAVESILKQTYTNIELIIIDDASTDGTLSLVTQLQSQNPQVIKCIRNEKNLGISKSLNKGLAYCEGFYIARADGDDVQYLDRIQKQVDFLEKNQDYHLVGCWVKNMDENGKEIADCEYPIYWELVKEAAKFSSPILHIWTARSELYKKLNGYRATNPAEDYDFILRCIDLGLKVTNIPCYGSYIRLRTGGTITESSLKQRVVFEYLRKSYLNKKINDADIVDKIPNKFNNFIVIRLHKLSMFFLKKGLEDRKSLKGMAYILLSLISPYTLRDIIRRRRFRQLMKVNNKI